MEFNVGILDSLNKENRVVGETTRIHTSEEKKG